MNNINYAKRVFRHYFQLAVGGFDADCGEEVNRAVDEIVEAAVAQAQSRFAKQLSDMAMKFSEHIDRLERQVENLEARLAQLEKREED